MTLFQSKADTNTGAVARRRGAALVLDGGREIDIVAWNDVGGGPSDRGDDDVRQGIGGGGGGLVGNRAFTRVVDGGDNIVVRHAHRIGGIQKRRRRSEERRVGKEC